VCCRDVTTHVRHASMSMFFYATFTSCVYLQDRCHRIGQTRPVTVYKLFAADTVDEDIFDMGERKSKLSKAVLQDDRQRQAQPQQQSGRCGSSAYRRSLMLISV
jgi:hypothetical protein